MNTNKNRRKVLMACLCAFTIGFFANPIIYCLKGNNILSITDSTFVHMNKNERNLMTPNNGFHSYMSPKGNLYIGIWKDGDIGYGTIVTDKSVYEGEICGLSPHGFGTMYYNNGNMYRGNWTNGNKEGIGIKRNRDGRAFFGHWRAGLYNMPKNKNYKVEDYVYGIDISKYQSVSDINWKNIALYSDNSGNVFANKPNVFDYMQPVSFVFIKATQGMVNDPAYMKHIENARKHHIVVGSYHFMTIGDDIDGQIKKFKETVQWQKGDLPPVIDIESEWPSKEKQYIKELKKYGLAKMQENALTWLSSIEQFYGVRPIIYTSERWKRTFLTDKRFNKYDFWYARYKNIRPEQQNKWVFWQRTDAASLNGYDGRIDVNIFSGTYEDFLKFVKR